MKHFYSKERGVNIRLIAMTKSTRNVKGRLPQNKLDKYKWKMLRAAGSVGRLPEHCSVHSTFPELLICTT